MGEYRTSCRKLIVRAAMRMKLFGNFNEGREAAIASLFYCGLLTEALGFCFSSPSFCRDVVLDRIENPADQSACYRRGHRRDNRNINRIESKSRK